MTHPLLRLPLSTSLAVLGAFLVSATPGYAINYGEVVPAGEHVPVGRVIVKNADGRGSSGTGTLIAPDLVLTAAHVVDNALTPWDIQFELDPLQEGGEKLRLPVLAFRTHPRYTLRQLAFGKAGASIANDVAVLKLAVPIPASVKPYHLSSSRPSNNDQVTVVGYGLDENNKSSRKLSGQLRYIRPKSDFLIFAVTPGKFQQSDHGDSGGPLLMKSGDSYEIVATVQGGSFAEQFDRFKPDEYGYYCDVSLHTDWILNCSKELQEVSLTGVIRYMKRVNDPSQLQSAISMKQIIALQSAGTPLERLLERMIPRGVSDPINESNYQFLTKTFPGITDRFVTVDLTKRN